MAKRTISSAGHITKTVDPKEKAQIEKLSRTLNKGQIAALFGIGKTRWHQLEKLDPELNELYLKGKSLAITDMGENLISQAKSGNVQAAIFYLKTQAGWTEQQKVDLTSSDGTMTPKNFNDFYPKQDEDDKTENSKA